jgi:hypothetical protein
MRMMSDHLDLSLLRLICSIIAIISLYKQSYQLTFSLSVSIAFSFLGLSDRILILATK